MADSIQFSALAGSEYYNSFVELLFYSSVLKKYYCKFIQSSDVFFFCFKVKTIEIKHTAHNLKCNIRFLLY